jgi:hypothetical protein
MVAPVLASSAGPVGWGPPPDPPDGPGPLSSEMVAVHGVVLVLDVVVVVEVSVVGEVEVVESVVEDSVDVVVGEDEVAVSDVEVVESVVSVVEVSDDVLEVGDSGEDSVGGDDEVGDSVVEVSEVSEVSVVVSEVADVAEDSVDVVVGEDEVGVSEVVVVESVVGVVELVVVLVGAVEVEVGAVSQPGMVKVLLSRLTWPLRASARPATTVFVVTEIDVRAMIVPTKSEFVPSVAELPTCQKTWHAWAPLITLMSLAEAVIRVEAIWKMKTELGSPWPSRVTVPLTASGPVDLNTPAVSVCPTRSPATKAVGARLAASA